MPGRIRSVAIGMVVAVVLLAGAQLARVHHETGELRFTASATPATIYEYGRLYRRGEDPTGHQVPNGMQVIGSTAGGGEVLGPRHVAVHGAPQAVVPTVLYVLHGRDVVTYALSGGP